jgi:FdrA protein
VSEPQPGTVDGSVAVRVLPETYVDSVLLLAATRAMSEVAGVTWATAVMATPANVTSLAAERVPAEALSGVGANDLVLAARSVEAGRADDALEVGTTALLSPPEHDAATVPRRPRALPEALAALPAANVVVVSVPGPFAALEAHKALRAGRHVLLFSDNVDLDDEIALKDHAASRGLLLMGPGAGTAVLGGCCLGFSNVVRAGRVGVVAAAGTGAQEVMTLLDHSGEGVTQVIGVGGRDLSDRVGGRMARLAVRALDGDAATELIVLVSKPPSPDVARAVVAEATTTPIVAALVGLEEGTEVTGTAGLASTLEGGVRAALHALGAAPPVEWQAPRADIAAVCAALPAARRLVRGLYSGGTLCYEALVVLQRVLGPVWSNTPLDPRYALPAPASAHVCLDLGEEEFTRGRPHPMIDLGGRIELLHESAARADTGAVVLDVVLGYGAHPDPAAELAPVCAELLAAGGPPIVVHVLGTEADPQGLSRQRDQLRAAGCVVAPTGARAALASAAIVLRRPELVETSL